MNVTKKSVWALICYVLLISCERKTLQENYETSVPVSVDWSELGEGVDNVTVMVYENGKLVSKEVETTNDTRGTENGEFALDLPAGKYDIYFYTGKDSDREDGVIVDGADDLSTINFKSNNVKPLESGTTSLTNYISQPDEFAVFQKKDVVITENMANYATSGEGSLTEEEQELLNYLSDLKAEKKTCDLNIKLVVAGFDNIDASYPVLMEIHNIANGYIIEGDKNSSTSASMQFVADSVKFVDGSFDKGEVVAKMRFWGLMGNRLNSDSYGNDTRLELYVRFKTIDGRYSWRGYDITNAIDYENYPNFNIEIANTDLPDSGSDNSGSDNGGSNNGGSDVDDNSSSGSFDSSIEDFKDGGLIEIN